MIERLVDACLHEWKMVMAVALLLLCGGAWALRALDIEAYPDPAPPIVELLTQNASRSAEEMEQQITVPLESALNGMQGLEHMRSVSLFGLSDVKCYFSYDTDPRAARQEVINRMQSVTLPTGVQPQLSPESTIGEIYRYQLVGQGCTLRELKETQDWVIQRRLRQVPGVIDVVGFGGPTRELHVDLDPRLLASFRVSVGQVMSALQNANSNAGANAIEIGAQSYNVRGIGLFRDADDIRDVVVTSRNGVPVYVRQLGDVRVGRRVPLGRVGRDNVEDIVEGIVLMRPGEKSLPTLERLKVQIDRLNAEGLPKGMKIVPYSDRTTLIGVTTHTVEHTLITGMLLVAFILYAFLGDLRASLIVALTIPLSLCFVFIVLVLRGESANLISMGAIDFGIIVDASVVMIENIHRHLSEPGALRNPRLVIAEASREVVGPIFFSTIIIFVSFLPLFTMQGVEGKIFGPMALTYGLALSGALLLAFTFCPVAAVLLLEPQAHHETFIVASVQRPYRWLLQRAVGRPARTTLAAVALLLGTGLLIPRLGGEFMPKLEEGNLWVRATMPTSISYRNASEIANRVRAVFDGFPEVETVVSQLGRPDDGTDPTSWFNCEFFVGLTPREGWPDGLTKAELVSEMEKRLEAAVPGVDFNFSQAIEDNVEEAMSGVKGENSIKIYGRDLETLERVGSEIEQVMREVPGVKDLALLHELGQPNARLEIDRRAAARLGVQVADVNALISAAIGGSSATQMLSGDRRYDVVVRLQPAFRDTPQAISRIPVPCADGNPVPLGQVASLRFKSGAGFIYHEDNERFIPIKFSVRGRDLDSTITDARRRITEKVKLPEGYRLEWSGEFQEMQAALDRLEIVVPLSLLIILVLLAKAFGSSLDAILILGTVPLAGTGGFLALLVRGMSFSISAAVGFVSLFGVCVLQGVLLLSRVKQLRVGGASVAEAVERGSTLQMRPVLMVALSAAIGLLPAALSNGIGSETQRPLATVVVGGMITSAVVILFVLPAVYRLLEDRRRGGDTPLETGGPT